jgi:Niemann-Pick C1 protein
VSEVLSNTINHDDDDDEMFQNTSSLSKQNFLASSPPIMLGIYKKKAKTLSDYAHEEKDHGESANMEVNNDQEKYDINNNNVETSQQQPSEKIIDFNKSPIEQDFLIQPNQDGFLFKMFKNYYAPFLMNNRVRPAVIILFIGLFCTSVALLPKVEIGLDQKLSMPKDSYVLDYFLALENYLSVGVPVYFVLKNADNYSSVRTQNLICSSGGCNIDSMLNQINIASLQADYTTIAIPANSWLDDYFDWLSSGDCCRVYANGTFCPSSDTDDSCTSCVIRTQPGTNRPVDEDFYKYFKFYIKDNPGLKCAKGGHAAYGEAVEILPSNNDTNSSGDGYSIGASFFMAYHKVGVKSADFIDSLKHANLISANITKMMRDKVSAYSNDTALINSIEVIPYSLPYVYYEQYLTIWHDAAFNLSISLAAIFIVSAILLGLDFYTSFLISMTIGMIIVNMFGALYLFHIELNAVSLVNLVMVTTTLITLIFKPHSQLSPSLSFSLLTVNRYIR